MSTVVEMGGEPLPLALARRIGSAPPLPGEAPPEPQTKLDWALHWHHRGLSLVCCKEWLGTPIKDCETNSQIIAAWKANPNADIAAVPRSSGHFVIAAVGERGRESLDSLEERYGAFAPDFSTENRWGDLHLWFKGEALTSHNFLAPGIHVYGAGTIVYMPPSAAPSPSWS
jgi:Bifunctional DNA primase/polymerase, N-terminal